jgi:hypothetical protein
MSLHENGANEKPREDCDHRNPQQSFERAASALSA